ncbi:MAG: hypothetical protein AAF329_28970 [Cyanobacteria bacterium P01_A01_bin.17]
MTAPTLKLGLIGAGLALSCFTVALPKWADAQSYNGLPLNLHKTLNTQAKMYIRLDAKPQDKLVLRFDIYDADILDEGDVYVNGTKVASLFGQEAKPENDRQTTQVTLRVRADVWQVGTNRVVFVRKRTNGFKVTGLSISEVASDTQPTPTGSAQPLPSGLAVTMQDLVEAVTMAHEISPLPSVPANWRFARYPIPSTRAETQRLDRAPSGVFSLVNPWNHVDSVKGRKPLNAMVELGNLHLAVYVNGKWREHDFGPPCVAAEHPFGQPGVRFGDRGRCERGNAYVGLGFNGWTNPKHHTHGWSPTSHASHNSRDIKHVIAWGSARTVPIDPRKSADLDGGHYQYRIGADKRNPAQKGVLPAITHGRAMIVRPQGQIYLAHTMSPSTLKRLCQQKKLPPSLPFRGSC